MTSRPPSQSAPRPSIDPSSARSFVRQRRPSIERFRARTLSLLRCTASLTQAQEAALSQLVHRGVQLEPALLELGVDSRTLVRAMLNAKGAFALDAGPYVAELTVHRHVPKSQAHLAGLIPVMIAGKSVYAFVDAQAPKEPPAVFSVAGVAMDVVVLGKSAHFSHDLDALYRALESVDPDTMHASFPEYLVLRELMLASARSAHAERVHDADHWAELCVQLGASESDVYAAAAAYFDIPFLSERMMLTLEDPNLDRPPVPRAYLDAMGFSVLRRIDDVLLCACYRIPQDQSVEQLLRQYDARGVLLCLSTPTAVRAHLRRVLEGPLEAMDEAISEATHEIALESMNLDRFPEIPREFNKLLLQAIKSRASDIHLERGHHRVGVRFRVDGAFVNVDTPWLTQENVLAFVTKVKVDSALDISERRRPQDGVLRRRVGTRTVDFRVAVQPTLWGESVVLRVLDQSKGAPQLDELGMSGSTLSAFRRLLENPHGLILLTGPTGSGKTTTLYAALQELKKNNLKIVTAEDPVEYAMEGIQQSAVDEGIGNTFDRFLRAFLRQDPDVILVGEIRDPPTAEMTLRAALTGHLVFSTLHVNDAPSTVSRLRDLGVSLNVLSESLLCVVGQRLVRRVCSTCAQPTTPAKSLLEECFATGVPADATFLSGRGCDVCRGTGYKGRVALVELWAPSVVERDLIQRGASSLELRDHALQSGIRTMLEDAREKMASGITTPQEVRSAMSYDELHRVRNAR